MPRPVIGLLIGAVLFAAAPPAPAAEPRPRLVVLTDIGGDPDDQQSLIRLMLYSNELEIEGLIASASGTPGELKETVVRPDLIRQIVEAYGRVRPNLARHAEGYPPAEELLGRIKSGNPHRGLDHIGPGHDTEGSDWLIRCGDASDRPLCITIWGGQTDLAQALWRVRRERSAAELNKFLQKLRIYDVSDQDRIQPWIFENFPDLFYVLAKAPAGRDKREGAYRGMYLGGDESSTSLAWLDQHVRKNHGPLGELYPPRTWTEPNPHGALKEGDTPSWFFFRPSALSDPAHPEWGGWGGRFRRAERGLWRDVPDLVDGRPDPRASVWRWRPIFQREFQARFDWCVAEHKDANHSPVIAIDGTPLVRPLVRTAAAGSTLRLDASRSTDPDGHKLSFHWWLYHDAGNMSGAALRLTTTAAIGLDIPLAARGQTAHLIIEATDDGNPPLTACARIVVTAE